MTDRFETVQLKLVTIAPFGLADSIAKELRALGATGYTKAKADGWGVHGSREYGLVDSANIRFDVLADAEIARKILHGVPHKFAADAIVAFAHDVEAAPRRHVG